MKLFTKTVEAKTQAQFHLDSNMENQVIASKFFNPTGAGTWWLMNQDPNNPGYLWGVVQLFGTEVRSFLKSDLENYRGRYGLGIERFTL